MSKFTCQLMILSYTDTARLHKTTWPTVTPVDKLIQAKATHKKTIKWRVEMEKNVNIKTKDGRNLVLSLTGRLRKDLPAMKALTFRPSYAHAIIDVDVDRIFPKKAV